MKRFNNADSFAQDEGQEFVSELQRKLILYGTTPVLEAWLTWWRAIQSEHVEGDPSLLLHAVAPPGCDADGQASPSTSCPA